MRIHPFPCRTRKLSSQTPKVLGWKRPGRIGSCQIRKTPETVSFLFASIRPGRFWGACYVRKYKLNFRNREMLDKRQHFPFREIEASLSQIWLKPDNSGVSLQAATAGGGVIRAEVIDGAKSSQFTKWGRKYLPGTAWRVEPPEENPPAVLLFQTILWTI